MRRRWKTNIVILVAAFLIFTAGYFVPYGDNLTAIAMWVLLLVATVCFLAIRWNGGNPPVPFFLWLDVWRRRFRRFALDEDDKPTTHR